MAPFTGGVYARRGTGAPELGFAFAGIFERLADHRLTQLPREADPVKASGVYEFPREFRKLRQLPGAASWWSSAGPAS